MGGAHAGRTPLDPPMVTNKNALQCMRTARLLPVSPGMHCSQGEGGGPGGVPGLGGCVPGLGVYLPGRGVYL